METMNKIYKKHGAYAMVCVTYLMQIGFDNARALTDEYLAKTKAELEKKDAESDGMMIMTPDFQIWLMETAREIAQNMTEVKLIQWIQVNKPYDTRGIKKA